MSIDHPSFAAGARLRRRRLLGAASGAFLAQALPSQAQTRRAVHTVVIDGMQFIPAVLEVKAGDTVVWVNRDPFPHTATSDSEGFDSGNLPAGGRWAFVTKRPGAFPYACALHETMKGTLIVK